MISRSEIHDDAVLNKRLEPTEGILAIRSAAWTPHQTMGVGFP